MPPKRAIVATGQTPYKIFKRADRLIDGERVYSKRRQEQWLRQSQTWSGLDSSLWKATRVLGVGGNGIVGQWEYQGTDPNMPKNIVIKQGSDGVGMGWESRLLKILAATGSDHFVKLYKAVFRAMGTGTSIKFDDVPFDNSGNYSSNFEVNRLYIEYCEKGDLSGYTKQFENREQNLIFPPEEYVWRIFGCLARACLVLETGSEDPDTPDPNHVYPIAHFDIKRANILAGGRDNGEHSRFNIMKLADFGLALPVPPAQLRRTQGWIEASQWRATKTYMSPEQLYPGHRNRDIGVPTNMWATGAVMHDLIYGRPPTDQKFPYLLKNPSSGKYETISVQGNLLITPITQKNGRRIYLPYSRLLIDTILYCLAFDPAERLTAADLVRRIQTTLNIYEKMNAPPTTQPVSNCLQTTITPPAKTHAPTAKARQAANPRPTVPPRPAPRPRPAANPAANSGPARNARTTTNPKQIDPPRPTLRRRPAMNLGANSGLARNATSTVNPATTSNYRPANPQGPANRPRQASHHQPARNTSRNRNVGHFANPRPASNSRSAGTAATRNNALPSLNSVRPYTGTKPTNKFAPLNSKTAPMAVGNRPGHLGAAANLPPPHPYQTAGKVPHPTNFQHQTNIPPPAPPTDPWDNARAPNFRPAGYPTLAHSLPFQGPVPNLQGAGFPTTHKPVSFAYYGPDPVDPKLLFPPEPPIRPQTMQYADYPFQFMPPTP